MCISPKPSVQKDVIKRRRIRIGKQGGYFSQTMHKVASENLNRLTVTKANQEPVYIHIKQLNCDEIDLLNDLSDYFGKAYGSGSLLESQA